MAGGAVGAGTAVGAGADPEVSGGLPPESAGDSGAAGAALPQATARTSIKANAGATIRQLVNLHLPK